jgi:hypothetical protein
METLRRRDRNLVSSNNTSFSARKILQSVQERLPAMKEYVKEGDVQ